MHGTKIADGHASCVTIHSLRHERLECADLNISAFLCEDQCVHAHSDEGHCANLPLYHMVHLLEILPSL